jgi:hypothetical protein
MDLSRQIPVPVGIARRNFFLPSVKWITSASRFPGHEWAYRAAQADFNVRGWQGRWRYTAPTALFFLASGRGFRLCPKPNQPAPLAYLGLRPAGCSQAGDLRSAGIYPLYALPNPKNRPERNPS